MGLDRSAGSIGNPDLCSSGWRGAAGDSRPHLQPESDATTARPRATSRASHRRSVGRDTSTIDSAITAHGALFVRERSRRFIDARGERTARVAPGVTLILTGRTIVAECRRCRW